MDIPTLRKSFKVLPIKILSPRQKFKPVSLPNLIRTFQGPSRKTNSIISFYPDREKVADIFALFFSKMCPFGTSPLFSK